MKKFFPLLFIFAVIVIFFRQFFLSYLLPIPSDTIVGLYHPFRDAYAKDYPRGIPFKNFLITDPVRQQYPWRFESILQEKALQLPLWNPYNFAGTPLFANQQSAALYPLNILFFILPFSVSWSFLIFLEPILAGLFLFLFLKNLKLHTAPSLLGAFAFTFSGFFISWLEWGTIDHVALWLPLLLLSVDKMFVQKFQSKWMLVFVLAFIMSFFAGHMQTFFYLSLIVYGYILVHLLQAKEKMRQVLITLGLSILVFTIVSVQLIPLFQFILHSGRDSDLVIREGWFIPWQHIITFFVPDFFGNPTTLNYWGVWNYAELAGYIGIPALFFSFYAICVRRDWRTWFFASATLVALLFALPTYIAYLPLQFHIPFFSTAQPTRLLFVVDFGLAILAAIGLDNFVKNGKRFLLPLVLFIVVFASLWTGILFHAKLGLVILPDNLLTAKRNLVFPTTIFALTAIAIVIGSIFREKKKIFTSVLVALLLITAVDVFRFADKFTPFTNAAYLFPSTQAIQFLQKNTGNSRIMATDSQILPPNFSLAYHLQSIDGYDPLYIREYGQLVAALERGKPDIHTPFGFNRIITPQNYQNRLIDLLGVKYILSLTDLRSEKLHKVFSEGQTQIYENTNVFPRAFFVKNVVSAQSPQDAANFLFDQKNNLREQATVEGQGDKNFTTVGSVAITTYSANSITMSTSNTSDGFLVLTDVYYPTWHAYVDGKETVIYRADLALRGIFVPKGAHTVRFTVQLF